MESSPERKKLYLPSLYKGAAYIALAVLYGLSAAHTRMSDGIIALFVLCFGGMGIAWIVRAFHGAPEEPVPDPRPLTERWREQMQSYDAPQLHAIMDDPLRCEEIRALARELLEQKGQAETPKI